MKRMQDLVDLMEIQYQRAQQSLQAIIEQEMRIRSELEILKEHMHCSRKRGLHDEPEMRAMGADVVWEQWLERARTKLNLELAKVLATKEMHLTRVRKNFGKRQAAKAKYNQISTAHKKQRQMQNLEKTILHTLSKRQ